MAPPNLKSLDRYSLSSCTVTPTARASPVATIGLKPLFLTTMAQWIQQPRTRKSSFTAVGMPSDAPISAQYAVNNLIGACEIARGAFTPAAIMTLRASRLRVPTLDG